MNTNNLPHAVRIPMRPRNIAALVVVVISFILVAFAASSARAAECATGQQTFESVGAEQCYTVPSGVTAVTVTAIGAPGRPGSLFAQGGFGAVVRAQVPVAPGQTLYVDVGDNNGFNGGGTGNGGGGGGASDVRTCSAMAPTCPAGVTVATRLVVAGGGGGGASDGSQAGSGIEMFTYIVHGGPGGSAGSSPEGGGSGSGEDGASGGGPGGTNTGGTPGAAGNGTTSSGAPGTAGAEGSGGAGGAGYKSRHEGNGGGGGGGYYGGGGGGGGGYEETTAGGGGGGGAGSSFVESSATSGSIATDTNGKPSVTIVPVAAPSGTANSTEQPAPVGSSPPPSVTNAIESHRTWREGRALATISRRRGQQPFGTTFSFILSEVAQVDFSFSAQRTGRMSDGRCVAMTNKDRHKATCRRAIVVGALTFNAKSGSHKVAFQGRITSLTKLDPGTYTLVIVAANAAGRSSPRRLTFTITN